MPCSSKAKNRFSLFYFMERFGSFQSFEAEIQPFFGKSRPRRAKSFRRIPSDHYVFALDLAATRIRSGSHLFRSRSWSAFQSHYSVLEGRRTAGSYLGA